MAATNNRFVALLLSVMIPGLGQFYSRDIKKGLIIFGSCLSLGLLGYWVGGFNRIAVALALLLLWVSGAVAAYQSAKTFGRGADFYYRKPYVVAMLLLIGPLALPLLWQSPKFSRRGRWLWTSIVVGAALLFIATPYLVKLVIR
ncbi:MAG: hypothetical protein ACREQO_05265 [Candidatus Binatia bacterium]